MTTTRRARVINRRVYQCCAIKRDKITIEISAISVLWRAEARGAGGFERAHASMKHHSWKVRACTRVNPRQRTRRENLQSSSLSSSRIEITRLRQGVYARGSTANDTSQLTNQRKESRDTIGRVARRSVYQVNWNFHREHAVVINRSLARSLARARARVRVQKARNLVKANRDTTRGV